MALPGRGPGHWDPGHGLSCTYYGCTYYGCTYYQADIWSLGVCLFAMLCGYLPFEDPDTGALYKKILAGTYTVAGFVSAEAQDLIGAMLTTDPQQRLGAGAIVEHAWFVNRCAAPMPLPPLTLHPERLAAVMQAAAHPVTVRNGGCNRRRWRL